MERQGTDIHTRVTDEVGGGLECFEEILEIIQKSSSIKQSDGDDCFIGQNK